MQKFKNLREQAASGKKLVGTITRVVRNPAIAVFAQKAGLDFIMFDCEHGQMDIEYIHDTCMLANAIGLPILVRIPNLSKDYISCYLDAGCSGIMLPMLETVEQAKNLVLYSKYLPLGERGYTTTGSHTFYNTEPLHSQIMREANGRILTIGQIETKRGVENVDEISNVEGIDMLLVGPNDLSVSLGIPGDLQNVIELDAINKVAVACKKNGKLFSIHSGNALLQKFTDMLDVYMQGTDIDFLIDGMALVKNNVDSLLSSK